jgi:hypothetical protein
VRGAKSWRCGTGGALIAALLFLATLGASACGDGGTTDAPGKTTTPAGARESQTATATPSPSGRALQTGPPRTRDAVLRHIAGRRVKAAGRTIRIQSDTVTCGGVGRPSRRRRDRPAWTRFSCIQPTFPSGSIVGPDLIFVVQSVAPHRLVVTRRHLASY